MSSTTLNQSTFPFQNCNVQLPEDQTGSVYLMMSLKDKTTVHIDTTMCLRTTLRQFNTGYGKGNIKIHLRPYVLVAYVCGFQRNKDLMHFVRNKWIENHDGNTLQWAKNAHNIIQNDEDLKLVCVFKER